jgi:serine/threonine protein kinase
MPPSVFIVLPQVITPLLKVLHSLHQLGIVHRDIKPENIFFQADGTLRLGDFGLAINASKERPVSRVGTLEYMAPEVNGRCSGQYNTTCSSASCLQRVVQELALTPVRQRGRGQLFWKSAPVSDIYVPDQQDAWTPSQPGWRTCSRQFCRMFLCWLSSAM